MPNAKISALTSATTPLAGTEVLPIVQSGATVKVANNDLRPKQIQSNATSGVLQIVGPAASATRVMTTPDANFTVARTDAAQSFTGDQTFSTGNLIQGTAAKGVNFTANTPAAGMTSQLLNWYEEGTYTATFTPTTSGSITLNASYNTLRYTRIGRQVTISGEIRVSSVSSPIGSVNLNLPFMAGASLCFSAFAIYDANGKTGGAITNANASTATFSDFGYNYISASDFSGNEQLIISLTYTV